MRLKSLADLRCKSAFIANYIRANSLKKWVGSFLDGMFMIVKNAVKMKKKFKPLNVEQKMTIQLLLGCFLAVFGVVLLTISFFVPPTGIIHSSVLAAIGEVFTFSGALIGIDYSYKYKTIKIHKEIEDEQE